MVVLNHYKVLQSIHIYDVVTKNDMGVDPTTTYALTKPWNISSFQPWSSKPCILWDKSRWQQTYFPLCRRKKIHYRANFSSNQLSNYSKSRRFGELTCTSSVQDLENLAVPAFRTEIPFVR